MSRRNLSFRLASELVIIFIGVYGAFWVERYRQDLEDRERALSILEALSRELGNVMANGPLVRDGMAAALAAFDASTAEGGRPPPAFYREPGAETPPVSVWEATVSSGGVNLLDPELFYDLAEFYNRVESFSQRYLRYNETTEQEVLPRLSLGAEAFYDPRSGELDPLFRVHMDQLRTLHGETVAVIQLAASLQGRVLADAEALR